MTRRNDAHQDAHTARPDDQTHSSCTPTTGAQRSRNGRVGLDATTGHVHLPRYPALDAMYGSRTRFAHDVEAVVALRRDRMTDADVDLLRHVCEHRAVPVAHLSRVVELLDRPTLAVTRDDTQAALAWIELVLFMRLAADRYDPLGAPDQCGGAD